MKRITLLLALSLLLAGCADADEKVETGSAQTLYFVTDSPRGFKLVSELVEFPKSENLGEEIISDLLAGKIAPRDSDYSNLWGSTNTLNSITTSGSIATIDLGTISLNVGSESEQRAIDQIVWTYLKFNAAIKEVRFTVNGEVVESFAGHVDTTKTFSRAPAYEVLNPIQISSLIDGQELSNPIEISGQACTFEANVVWRLSKAGTVVKEGFTSASAACPDRSPWSVTIGKLDSGTYKFEALEYSAEDGLLSAIDDKTFVVK